MSTLYARFDDLEAAEKAAGALLDHGFDARNLSVVSNHHIPDSGVRLAGPDAVFAGDTDRGQVKSSVGDEILLKPLGGATIKEVESQRRVVNTSDAIGTEHGTYVIDAATEVPVSRVMDDDERGMFAHAEHVSKHGITTTSPEDAGEGAFKGAEIGMGLGILAGLASLLVPGVGLIYGGGALAAAIGAAAATTAAGAVAGGIAGYLKDQGVPHETASRYGAAVEAGGSVIALQNYGEQLDESKVQEILRKYGCDDFESH